MDRRSFLGGLAGLALTLPASRALAALPRAERKGKLPGKTPTAPPPPATGGLTFTAEQLRGQKLDPLPGIGPFRFLHLAPGERADQTFLVELRYGDKPEVRLISAPVAKRHSIVLSPGPRPRHAFLPELEGRRAALVDLEAGKTIGTLETSDPDLLYSGHACISPDGRTLYLPEFNDKARVPSQVHAYELPSLRKLRTYPTGAFKAHAVALTRDARTLLVGHYGFSNTNEPPSYGGLVPIELATGKVLPHPALENPYLALCHLETDADDNIFVSTRSWAGHTQLMTPVLFGRMGEEKWTSILPDAEKERFRFNFSLRLLAERNLLAVAHIEGNMVSFWDSRQRRYLGQLDLPNGPLGVEVTPDGRHFVVNTKGNDLHFIDANTRKIVKRVNLLGLGWSPHLAVLPLA